MTRDEILTMPAGLDMDWTIAEKVMGWTMHPHKTHWIIDEHNAVVLGCFQPSRDISAAWKVVEKMKQYRPAIGYDDENNSWRVALWYSPDPNDVLVMESADTAPLAICRAALLAVMEGDA